MLTLCQTVSLSWGGHSLYGLSVHNWMSGNTQNIWSVLYYFLFRVSIPRSTLMSPHHVKPQRRSQYEPSDSFALSKVGNKWCYYTLDTICIPWYLPIEIWKLESFKNLWIILGNRTKAHWHKHDGIVTW